MTLLEWIRRSMPGEELALGSELQFRHKNGSVSSIWLRDERQPIPNRLLGVRSIFGEVDGADLFSSAFKIASISEPRRVGRVKVVPSLEEMSAAASAEGLVVGPSAVIFMEQAGIGYYSIDRDGTLLEHDTETGDLVQYPDIAGVLDEWLAAVREQA